MRKLEQQQGSNATFCHRSTATIAGLALLLGLIARSDAETKAAPASLNQLKMVSAGEFTKIIDRSTSPDKRFAAAVGSPDGSKPVWEKSNPNEQPSFVLSDSTSHCRNYLLDLSANRVTGILDSNHFGTSVSHNNESCIFSWSDDSGWLVETQSWRLHSTVCTVHRVNAKGDLVAHLDFLQVARRIIADQLLKHAPKLSAEDRKGYLVTLGNLHISNDGTLTATLSAQQGKGENGVYLHLAATVKVRQTKTGSIACHIIRVETSKQADVESTARGIPPWQACRSIGISKWIGIPCPVSGTSLVRIVGAFVRTRRDGTIA